MIFIINDNIGGYMINIVILMLTIIILIIVKELILWFNNIFNYIIRKTLKNNHTTYLLKNNSPVEDSQLVLYSDKKYLYVDKRTVREHRQEIGDPFERLNKINTIRNDIVFCIKNKKNVENILTQFKKFNIIPEKKEWQTINEKHFNIVIHLLPKSIANEYALNYNSLISYYLKFPFDISKKILYSYFLRIRYYLYIVKIFCLNRLSKRLSLYSEYDRLISYLRKKAPNTFNSFIIEYEIDGFKDNDKQSKRYNQLLNDLKSYDIVECKDNKWGLSNKGYITYIKEFKPTSISTTTALIGVFVAFISLVCFLIANSDKIYHNLPKLHMHNTIIFISNTIKRIL
jgi:hypothetical protein